MSRPLGLVGAALVSLMLTAAAASAWHLDGHVYCDATGLPLGGIQISVVSTNPSAPFSGLATSDGSGAYFIALPNSPGDFDGTALLGGTESFVTPGSGHYLFSTTDTDFEIVRNFVISSPACNSGGCWLTGGGAKFSPITGTQVGEVSKRHNWGGNVNPGCSPTAGDGGEWNDIDALHKRHFHGTHIEVVRCGNVDGIPPGSTSPATPFNFIEFKGTGTLKGIQGNKEDFGTVYFFGRCEDRNEPGSNGQRDGAGKDRYFLNVYANPSDPVVSSLLLVDQDADPATVDPLIITDGNLQIHISSCSNPPASLTLDGSRSSLKPVGPSAEPAASAAASPLALAIAGRNPAVGRTTLRFALPREGRVTLAIHDVAGRAVRTLISSRLPAGEHQTSWDLRDQGGMQVSSGIYFVRLSTPGGVRSLHLAVTP